MNRLLPIASGFLLLTASCKKQEGQGPEAKVSSIERGDSRKASHAPTDSRLDNKAITKECQTLLKKEGELTVGERKRQLELLTLASSREPEKTLQLLKDNLDPNDLEISTLVIKQVMDREGQAVIIGQFRELKYLMSDRKDNRLMVAFIDALASQKVLETGTISFLRDFSGQDMAAGPIASLIRTRARGSGPDEALRLLDEIGLKGTPRNQSILAISGTLSQKDPAKALSLLGQVAGADTSTHYQNLFEKWFSKSPEVASKAFLGLSWKEKVACFQNEVVANKIVDAAGETVLVESLSDIPLTRAGVEGTTRILEMLARRNPELTIQSINDYSNVPAGKDMAKKVFEEMGMADPQAALKGIETMDPALRNDALSGLLLGSLKNNVGETISLIETNNIQLSQENMADVVSQVSSKDPAQAWSLLNDPRFALPEDSARRSNVVRGIANRWADTDARAASRWLGDLSQTDATVAVQPIVSKWVNSDPESASNWLGSLPSGPTRDAGALELIKQIERIDPEMAEQWRGQIGKGN